MKLQIPTYPAIALLLIVSGAYLDTAERHDVVTYCHGPVIEYEPVRRKDGIMPAITVACDGQAHELFGVPDTEGAVLAVFTDGMSHRTRKNLFDALERVRIRKDPITIWRDRHRDAILGLEIEGAVFRDAEEAKANKGMFGMFVGFSGFALGLYLLISGRKKKRSLD